MSLGSLGVFSLRLRREPIASRSPALVFVPPLYFLVDLAVRAHFYEQLERGGDLTLACKLVEWSSLFFLPFLTFPFFLRASILYYRYRWNQEKLAVKGQHGSGTSPSSPSPSPSSPSAFCPLGFRWLTDYRVLTSSAYALFFFFSPSPLPFVCCLLFAVCCLLFAVCCLLFAVCCLLFVVCCLLFVVCCLLLLLVFVF